MKCLILAAGFGTRLGDLALDKPKPLLEVAGRPILDYILDKRFDDLDCYVMSNEKFYETFKKWSWKKNVEVISNGVKTLETKKGSIGDIYYAIKKLNINEDLIVIGGDNIFDFSLKNFVSFMPGKTKIALYDVNSKEKAKLYGIVELDKNNKIVNFFEKPQNPSSTLAATLVYFFPKDTLKYIEEYVKLGLSTDKAGDYIAWLSDRVDVFGFVTKKKWFDIGSPESLNEANQKYK